MAVFKYSRMDLHPGTVQAMYRMEWVDWVENGLVNMSALFATGKRKHVRGYQRGLLTNRVKKKRDKELEHLSDAIRKESRHIVQAKYPLVLDFKHHHSMILPEALGFLQTDNVHAFWLCHTAVGTIVCAKFGKRDYRTWLMRPYQEESQIIITRTLQLSASDRATALSKLAGMPWVYKFGKLYSLYDLYKDVAKDELYTSVFFKFEDEEGNRTTYPRHHVRQIFIPHGNRDVEFIWDKNPYDPRWQPRPTYNLNTVITGMMPNGESKVGNGVVNLRAVVDLRKHATTRVWDEIRGWLRPDLDEVKKDAFKLIKPE